MSLTVNILYNINFLHWVENNQSFGVVEQIVYPRIHRKSSFNINKLRPKCSIKFMDIKLMRKLFDMDNDRSSAFATVVAHDDFGPVTLSSDLVEEISDYLRSADEYGDMSCGRPFIEYLPASARWVHAVDEAA